MTKTRGDRSHDGPPDQSLSLPPSPFIKIFRILADEGVNIQMISTSTIRVSVVCAAGDMERAARSLHSAFGLDSGADYAAPAVPFAFFDILLWFPPLSLAVPFLMLPNIFSKNSYF